ncbi:MAG: HD domain-containing protein [Clostridia bacterium]|nr:HD domain-containing protein [Clostridia bacterium]
MTKTENEKECVSECDFLCEKRLLKTNPALHRLYRSSVFAMDMLLSGYKNIFPFFTDHTFEHSEQVINYCNIIAGKEIVPFLNSDEIYILLMGAALHDVGMGISEDDFHCFCSDIPGLAAYRERFPGELTAEYTRAFHQEFSAQFIKKYSGVFEIPSEEHIHCIAQVARGHRNADLLDRDGFPEAYPLPNGNTVNLAYLAALVKFADELDVTADRNLFFDYTVVNREWSAKQTMCFKCHGAIKSLCVRDDAVVLMYDTQEPEVEEEILRTYGKVENTFGEYITVLEKRTSFPKKLSQLKLEKVRQL